ncbi:hypothetical protein [Magnetospira sp. QH-2]|uniref:hypothetical protein n=1 Tax=Magnetospira sp. (strain QH-2) TaxID=1288970 RepID=UPI0003E80B6A|nr:hypothetical protein [Magnetospira sp. QH-2]CCQ72637.1 protein of unknown function [Magnetospira sp. QH-2]
MTPINKFEFKPGDRFFEPVLGDPEREKLSLYLPKEGDTLRLGARYQPEKFLSYTEPISQDIHFDGRRIARYVSILGDAIVAQFQCRGGYLLISNYERAFQDLYGECGALIISYVTEDFVLEDSAIFALFSYFTIPAKQTYDQSEGTAGHLSPEASPIYSLQVRDNDSLTFRMKEGPKVWLRVYESPKRGLLGWLGFNGTRCGPNCFEPRRLWIHRSVFTFFPSRMAAVGA